MKLVLQALIATAALAALPLASAHAQAPSDAKKAMAAENFMQADANEDGALTRGEFETLINLNAEDNIGKAKMVRRFGRYDTAFGRIDANADGFATPEEMKALAEQAKR